MLYGNTHEKEYEKQLISSILKYSMNAKDAETATEKLIDEFGCAKNILSAEIIDLKTAADISETCAVALSLVGMMIQYTQYEQFGNNPVLSDLGVRQQFVQSAVAVMPYEDFYLFLLNEKDRLIKIMPVSHGEVKSVEVNKRFVADVAVKHGAKSVIAVHTHPQASSEPSGDDITSTVAIAAMFKKLGIRLVDHIIVGSDGCFSMSEHGIIEI